MKKEIRVYAIGACDLHRLNAILIDEVSDEDFMKIAEEEGNVWTLERFQESYNHNFLGCPNQIQHYIRFIEVEVK